MDVCLQLFCCCCRQEEPEKNPLIRSETLQYFNQLVKRKRAEATNLWNEPVDSTHMERDDDRELYNLLQKRAKLRRGSEGYRRLSFDISAHRQIRREVKDRWKHILEALGMDTSLVKGSRGSWTALPSLLIQMPVVRAPPLKLWWTWAGLGCALAPRR
ncbi:PREDICTED: melanoregulin-like [Gavialis gangeticus]|uniref:melanoregulin-like n=1 Tax=Gavialis gangeticus TaxID=94835 RepID=UPI00092F4DA0|nr:PREDICTED: melanoregulin-like [Gavialis gangeticus]